MIKSVFILLLLFPLLSCAQAGKQEDVTFIVAGKTANYRQQGAYKPYLLNYHFFAEIFPKQEGRVVAKGLLAPGRSTLMPFEDLGYVYEVHGGRYQSEQMLANEFPNGSYLFHYSTTGLGAVSQKVLLGDEGSRANRLPAPPQILLYQGGQAVDFDTVNPDLDLVVRWSDFADGRADPGGVMDDLVFVIMGDCEGNRTAHSGRPFENRPFLTYKDTEFVISADKLMSGNSYQLQVEHALLDTTVDRGVPAFATFATTTFLDIKAKATQASAPATCAEIRKRFDPGQTDR